MSVRALPDAHLSGKVHVACIIIKPATVDNTWSRPNSDRAHHCQRMLEAPKRVVDELCQESP